MKKILVVLGLVLVFLAARPRLVGQPEQPDKKKVDALMQRKLAAAQKLLDGIATGDFDKIKLQAETLNDISKEAAWRVLKTPRYEMFSNDFQRTAQTLIQNARDKNMDAAALSYVDLTLTCVKCHKHVREVRMVRAD